MEFNATFIVAFISFVIFIIIMNQILYKPINDILEKRQNLIDENYNEASKNQEKSKAILQDRLDKLQNARSRVKKETSDAIEKAKEEKLIAQKKAKEDTKSKIDENMNLLNQNEREAQDTLKGDIIDLAQIISDKFIETPNRIENIDSATVENIMHN